MCPFRLHLKQTMVERCPLHLNLLDILTVDNVYHLHALKFTHMWHKGLLPKVFDNLFQYAKSRHTYSIVQK